MLYIERHAHGWEPNVLKEQLDHSAEDLQYSLSRVAKKPDNLSSLLTIALRYAGYLSVLEPNSVQIYRALSIAANTISSIFSLADLSITEKYDLYVGEGPAFSFPQTGPSTYSDSVTWKEGYFLAAACREKHVLDSLVSRSTDIMRQSSDGVNEYSHLVVDALKSFYNLETSIEETNEKLIAVAGATDESKIRPLTIDATINIVLPEMELISCILEGNFEHFNESLADALNCHKRHWSSDEKMSGDPRGFIAIGLLGIACFAYDKGFPIEVESEYIPKCILEKQFFAQKKAS
jgi:Immunity protein 49